MGDIITINLSSNIQNLSCDISFLPCFYFISEIAFVHSKFSTKKYFLFFWCHCLYLIHLPQWQILKPALNVLSENNNIWVMLMFAAFIFTEKIFPFTGLFTCWVIWDCIIHIVLCVLWIILYCSEGNWCLCLTKSRSGYKSAILYVGRSSDLKSACFQFSLHMHTILTNSYTEFGVYFSGSLLPWVTWSLAGDSYPPGSFQCFSI